MLKLKTQLDIVNSTQLNSTGDYGRRCL